MHPLPGCKVVSLWIVATAPWAWKTSFSSPSLLGMLSSLSSGSYIATISVDSLLIQFISRCKGICSVANLSIWTRFSSSENITVSFCFCASCKRCSQQPSILAKVRSKHFLISLRSLASFCQSSLVLLARFVICNDNSKQVIMESWKMSLTSLTLLRFRQICG